MKVQPSPPRLKLVVDRAEPAERAPACWPDDTQLLAMVRAGDTKAANALYDRCRPVVHRALRKLLGKSDHEEQDVSQQVMVEIVRTIDRYRGDCSFDAWIGTLAAHVVYKNLRHRKVERRILSDAPSADVVAPDQPARRALLRSVIDRVKKHLAHLDPGRSAAFLLHDVHGYDLREMSEIMGVTVAAAQSRLVRGRKDLHARIADDPELAGHLSRWEGER
jgi:RNA polymerase sigma-70 factor, ECF subfamily